MELLDRDAKKKTVLRSDDDGEVFTLMRTGTKSDGTVAESVFDAIYMCFADYRKLDEDQRTHYTQKEMRRMADSIDEKVLLGVIVRDEVGRIRLQQAFRDVYYRLHVHVSNIVSEDEEEDDRKPDELDRSFKDAFEEVPPKVAHIWSQVVSPSKFEKEILGRWMDIFAVGSPFESVLTDKLDAIMTSRIHKWIKKGQLMLSKDKEAHVRTLLTQFTKKFVSIGVSWLFVFYKNLLSGRVADMDPFEPYPGHMLSVIESLLPFDIIVLSCVEDNQVRVVFDTMQVRSDGDASRNVVLLMAHEEPIHAESIGIVQGGGGKTKLTRLIAPDDPFVLSARTDGRVFVF